MIKNPKPIVHEMVPFKDLLAASKAFYRSLEKPAHKALKTATWARTMTKVIISRNNKKPPFWHVINFLGAGKQESAGIIDLLAIRKDHGKEGALPKGDGFEIILVQVKGGSARSPSPADIQRMEAVKKRYGAKAVVLSSWNKGASAVLRVLSKTGWGEPVDPDSIFGGKAVKRKSMAATKQKVSATPGKSVPGTSKRSAGAKAAWETRRKAAK